MALTAPKPRVRQTSTTTGTGTYSFEATIPDAHLGFVVEIGDTNTCHVLVTDSASNDWEWGIYTVGDASPDTLARTTVKRSTNSNAAVNWGAGTRTISVIWPPDVTEMLALLGVEAGSKDDQTASEIKTLLEDGIDSVHYVDGSIDTAHLAADVVTGDKIADDAIDSEHYTDGSIDNAHIADDAIDSEHYTDGSIDNAHIADDAIDSEHYAAGSIDEAHLANDAVTLAKMAGGTDGNIISYDASGNPVAVATGSDGEVLTSAGAGQPPAFEAAGGGGGKVLQVVSAITSTQVDSTSTTMADTSLTAAITPANTANKILILISQHISSAGGRSGGEIDVLRGTTVIQTYSQVSDPENMRANHFFPYLDSPSSTSSVTYKTQGARIDQSGTLQFQRNDASGDGASNITLIELDYS